MTSVGIGALFAKATAFLVGGLALPLGFGAWALVNRQRKRRDEVNRARGDARRYVNQVIAEIRDGHGSASAEHKRNLEAAEEELARKRATVQKEIDTLTGLTGRADALTAQLAVLQ
ncbi:hypothetical protein [Frankia sp. Cr1]|uniref:hypothetical protein n=1 Tax=Frankia sp. Cr1 TaxID=3073931 RepID=UPI002AD218A6|nr:hypothetical protein [Frankia sp. Cr1]